MTLEPTDVKADTVGSVLPPLLAQPQLILPKLPFLPPFPPVHLESSVQCL